MPSKLLEQLADGGRIVAPVGIDPDNLELVVAERFGNELNYKPIGPVFFLPLISKEHGGWTEELLVRLHQTKMWFLSLMFGYEGRSLNEYRKLVRQQLGNLPSDEVDQILCQSVSREKGFPKGLFESLKDPDSHF